VRHSGENGANDLCLTLDHKKLAVLRSVAEWRDTAHPHRFPFRGGDLVADGRSPMTSRSNCANDSRLLRVKRPIDVVVFELLGQRNKRRAPFVEYLDDPHQKT